MAMIYLPALTSLSLIFSRTEAAPPNIIFVVLDDMPFLEQWRESAPADLVDVLDAGYPTPFIDEFRSEAVIFSKSYCGAPKCAPSRYSLLTGRQPTRCQYIQRVKPSGAEGPWVSVNSEKMTPYDAKNSIPYVLKNNPITSYHTGMVGKWHMMDDDSSKTVGCGLLDSEPDADLYEVCTEIVKSEMDFDFVDAWFHGNINKNNFFSHNPEWMVERSQAFIEEARVLGKPFFLYFAATLVHTPEVMQALQKYDCADTPKGTLSGYETPNERTTMWPRTELLQWVDDLNVDSSETYAKIMWTDQMLEALTDYLKINEIYDDTFIAITNDHGMDAKGLLYQKGTRIFNFVRYPALFGKDGPNVLPPDFVVSNVDFAPTIFDLAGVTPPDDYVLDGKSYLADVSNAIHHPGEFEQTSCDYKIVDMFNSHAIMSGDYQYIWRATDQVDEWARGFDMRPEDVYPNIFDMEQLYDLGADPSQQINILNDAQRTQEHASAIAKMQQLMRQYIQRICTLEEDECLMPELLFTTTQPQLLYTTGNGTAAAASVEEEYCCYANDLQNQNAMKCFDIGDNEVECEKKRPRWGCAFGRGDDCAVPELPTPEPPQAGCCFGSSSKCSTPDKAQCLKMANRAGCEWRIGDATDLCAVPEPEPGCCFGSNAKCSTDDEARCLQFAARAGCEWRSGADADCTALPVEEGCCVGAGAKCDTDDAEKCNRFAARAGCEWQTGAACESGDQERVLSVLHAGGRLTNAGQMWLAMALFVAVLVVSSFACKVRAAEQGCAAETPFYGSTGQV